MTDRERMRVLLVDPSLFTAPYDAALSEGLLAAGVEPTWAVRPIRTGDRQEIAAEHSQPLFYRHVDQLGSLPRKARAIAKGLAHVLGLARVIARVVKHRPDAVHFQWLVVPPLDTIAIAIIRRFAPVLLTVHDTVPFNGEYLSFWQNFAFDLPIKLSDGVVVHTRAGRETLLQRGISADKLHVIAHGPLPLHARPSSEALEARADRRFTFVLFGEIKSYKGLDVLIEALGLLPSSILDQARFIVAGRARMDLTAIETRIGELGLERAVELRPQRLSDQEMADLFAASDCFLFPYRQIDASGVYFLVKSLGKWLIASDVGVFAEDLVPGEQGVLVKVGDAVALASAIRAAIEERPQPAPVQSGSAWASIGAKTRELYQRAQARRRPLSSIRPPSAVPGAP